MRKINLSFRSLAMISLALLQIGCTPIEVREEQSDGVPDFNKKVTDEWLDLAEKRKSQIESLSEMVEDQKWLFPKANNFPNAQDLQKDWKAPRILSATSAVYPDHLKYAHQEGFVRLAVLINEEGKVADTVIIRTTNDKFNDAAVETVKKWKFKPSLFGNKPYASVLEIPIAFRLEPEPHPPVTSKNVDPSCRITNFGYVQKYKVQGKWLNIPIDTHADIEARFLARESSIIPISKGIAFGFEYTLENVLLGSEVETRVRHPTFTDPETGRHASETIYKSTSDTLFAEYKIDYPDATPKGLWTVALIYSGKELCSKSFELIEKPVK